MKGTVFWWQYLHIDREGRTGCGTVNGGVGKMIKLRACGLTFGALLLLATVLSGCGGSNNSATAAPTAPTGVAITPGNAQVTIRWAAVAGASSYDIYWSTTTGATPAAVTKISAATSPYVLTGLSNGTVYSFAVSAANSYGESSPSDQLTSVPAPSISVIQSGENAFTLLASGFNAPAGFHLAVHYDPSCFTNPQVVQGSLIGSGLFAANLNIAGTVQLIAVNAAHFSGDGPIATITFSRIGASSGAVTVQGSVVNASAQDLAVTFNGWFPPDSIATVITGAGPALVPVTSSTAVVPGATVDAATLHQALLPKEGGQ
jgi:hypothetical protein